MPPHRPVLPAQRGPAPSGLSHRLAAIPAACRASLDGELVRRRCRPDQGVTVIVPFIEVWIEQMYANVAAVLKVCAYVPPLESVPLLVKPPSILVTVCER